MDKLGFVIPHLSQLLAPLFDRRWPGGKEVEAEEGFLVEHRGSARVAVEKVQEWMDRAERSKMARAALLTSGRDVSDVNPDATVFGTDLVPMQPHNTPDNVSFYVDDANSPD
jgi:hypothetical protein